MEKTIWKKSGPQSSHGLQALTSGGLKEGGNRGVDNFNAINITSTAGL